MPGLATADLLSSLHALSGVVRSLFRREKTGRGDRIDVSMQHAALAGLPNVMGPAMAGRPQPDPKHERTTGGSAFYRGEGFDEIGRRRNYYRMPGGAPADAVICARSIP